MFNESSQNKKVFLNWFGYLSLFTVFVFSTYFFYASYVYSGEGASMDYTNCSDTTDNDSDTYIDLFDLECLRAPGIPDMDVNTDSGVFGTDNNTNDATPNFSVTCDGTQTVHLKDGGTLLASGTCSAIGEGSSVNFENVSLSGEGVHSITATQWGGSNGGTDGESTASEALIVTIDTVINTPGDPVLQNASDTGISNSDEYTSDNTPTFDISCETGAEVQLLLGGGSVGTGTCVGGTVAITSTVQGDGVLTFYAVQTDLANGSSVESGGSQITIDTIWEGGNPDSAPDLEAGSDSGSSSMDNITNDTTPTFAGVCSSGYVYLYDDGILSNYILCDGANYSISSDILASGSNSMTVAYGDLAGNIGSVSPALSVTVDSSAPATTGTPDLTAGTDLGSSSTDNLTSDSTPDFSITCETDATVTLYADGVSNQIGTCESSPVTITLGTISGTVEITAKQTDVAGNTSASFSSGLSVTIDTTAPTTSGAPDLTSGTDSGSSSADDITSDTTPTFTGSCTDGTTVQLYDDGVSSGSSTTCASSVFSLTTGTLASGSNSITFKETDTAGNTSSASTALVVTIDTTSPTISEDAVIATATDTTPAYSFTSSDEGTISYGGSCSSVTTNALASPNPIILDTLAVGTYSDCTIIVTDTAGNASNTLTITSFTISAPASPSEPEASSNTSGSSPSRTQTTTNTNNDTPDLPACSAGESFNRNTGLPCTTNTPEVPGCISGFSFSPLTGQACSANTPTTPNNPTPTNTPTTYKFLKDIPFGTIRSEDARQLQMFLNTHGFPVATTGVGSMGFETRYFGPATRAALAKFQKANNITPSVGYFGPKTRGYINGL